MELENLRKLFWSVGFISDPLSKSPNNRKAKTLFGNESTRSCNKGMGVNALSKHQLNVLKWDPVKSVIARGLPHSNDGFHRRLSCLTLTGDANWEGERKGGGKKKKTKEKKQWGHLILIWMGWAGSHTPSPALNLDSNACNLAASQCDTRRRNNF